MRLDLDTPGRWRIVFALGSRTLVEASFDVVATRAEVVNRAPNAIAVDAVRYPGGSSQCFVRTSLATDARPIAHASTSTGPTSQTVAFAKRW